MKNQKSEYKEKIRYKVGLPVLNIHAAGIDIGDAKHDIAICNKKGGLVSLLMIFS